MISAAPADKQPDTRAPCQPPSYQLQKPCSYGISFSPILAPCLGTSWNPPAAKAALAAGIKQVVFDRGAYLYHGRVKTLADAARESGLDF